MRALFIKSPKNNIFKASLPYNEFQGLSSYDAVELTSSASWRSIRMSLVYRISILTAAAIQRRHPFSFKNNRRPPSRPVAAHGIVSVIKMSVCSYI